ncbi:hypothetical protein [Streptomyces sp. NPDC004065]|uniref:hypothetical protein n=1 Tax=Streptomyces sp. NPDC004065 TaxID=3364689 RepID=UPI0038504E24
MALISHPRRFAMLTATTVLAAGGALVPASAFAAPQPTHTTTRTVAHGGHGHHHDRGDWHHGRHGDRDSRGGGTGNVVIVIGNGNTVPVNNGTVNTR